MNVTYHELDGCEHVTTWPDSVVIDNVIEVQYMDKTWKYAGTQDGSHHYREVES